jgi:hypothetical protein
MTVYLILGGIILLLMLPAILPIFLERDQPSTNMSVESGATAEATPVASIQIVHQPIKMEEQYEMV